MKDSRRAKSIEERIATSPLGGGNAPFVEGYYEQFIADPDSVPPELREWFESISDGAREQPRGPVEGALRNAARGPVAAPAGAASPALLQKQLAVLQLIDAFRVRGHLLAELDPLGLVRPDTPPELEPASHGLEPADYDHTFATPLLDGRPTMALRDILTHLDSIYRGRIGAEFAHITSAEERLWLQERFESAVAGTKMSGDEKRTILEQLTAAEGIERYLHTRTLARSVSRWKAADSLIPMLEDLIQRGGRRHARKWSSGWPIGAGSMCWSTCWASRRKSCFPNLKATTTPSR